MPLFDLFWSMLRFALLISWIWLVFSALLDIFRNPGLSGWGKARWAVLVIMVPLLGVYIYLTARAGSVRLRTDYRVTAQNQAEQDYIRSVIGSSTGVADEVDKLGRLLDQGLITEAQFESQRAKLLA